MNVTWIETTEALADWLGEVGEGPLAVDTEADSFHHYREKVCLVQLTAGDRHAIVDPLAAVDLGALKVPFETAGLRKVFHGADYDIRLLQRDFGLTLRDLYDTSVAARLTGETAIGLAALLDKHLGVTLDKSHQRADWSRRPLPEAMRAYAVEDTRHLQGLATILGDAARRLGRESWIREECERLESVRWKDRRDDDPEPFRRTKGAAALDPAGLAVLREIWGWREEVGRRRDRPVFRVLRDESLIALAKSPPTSVGDLAKVAGFPDSLLRSPSARDLVEAARRGAACPEALRPQRRQGVRARLDPAVETRLDRIRAGRDAVARELGLEASLLASRAVLEEMAKRFEAGDDPWTTPDLRAWQAELLRPALAS